MVVASLLNLGFAVQNFVDFPDGQVPAVTDEKFAHSSVTGSAHTLRRLENACQLFRNQIPAQIVHLLIKKGIVDREFQHSRGKRNDFSTPTSLVE